MELNSLVASVRILVGEAEACLDGGRKVLCREKLQEIKDLLDSGIPDVSAEQPEASEQKDETQADFYMAAPGSQECVEADPYTPSED